MERMPSPQQITWFLDLERTGNLNLDPPYQRKSVWTLKDRQYFLDTIFRNYPCPAIFIHKETDENGRTVYNVVDGKQRLQTILMFVRDELRISKDYGDVNLNGKKFTELDTSQKRLLWDYVIVVDSVGSADSDSINQVFDRLNRNSKNLNPQELRHAKFRGWFITEVEKETENVFWETVKISTRAKAKRMRDVQFVSELLMVILEKKIVGFSQDHISEIYADFDDVSDLKIDFEQDDYLSEKERVRKYVAEMENNKVVTRWATTANHFYTLWSLIALFGNDLPSSEELANKYNSFMQKVSSMTMMTDLSSSDIKDQYAFAYSKNSVGASTDSLQRTERLIALRLAVLGNEGN